MGVFVGELYVKLHVLVAREYREISVQQDGLSTKLELNVKQNGGKAHSTLEAFDHIHQMMNPLSKRWGCSSTKLPRAGSLQEVQEFCRSKTKTGEPGLFLTGMGGVVVGWWGGRGGSKARRRARRIAKFEYGGWRKGGREMSAASG